MMNISQAGIDLIKSFEGLELTAYLDSAGIPTIGYGTTRYENGAPVKIGQTIPLFRAEQLIAHDAGKAAHAVYAQVKDIELKQQQFDALVSLVYNIGIGAFQSSTVLRLVKANPDDQNIRKAFAMWNKATVNGKKVVIQGLVNRRKKEADYYFSE